MASIKRYTTTKGHAWRVQYRSPDGRSRTKQGFRTKDEAQAWADANSVATRTGTWVDPATQKTTVNELGTTWLTNQTHLKPSTYRTTEQIWRVHVQPRWGAVQIGAVRPSDVQAWISGINRSGATVRHIHACLAQILDVAVLDGHLKANPARGIKLPAKNKARHVFLTLEQLGRLADECGDCRALVWLLGTTGIRFGEAAALRVQDIDFLRGRITIDRNAVTVGGRVEVGTPKNSKHRVIAVPQFVLDMLMPLCAKKRRDALLWQRTDGDFIRVPSQGHWYYRALSRVQKVDKDFPRVTPHGLRHVAAGLLVSQGANVKVVQRQLGHSSAAMTLDVYADLFDGDLDAVAVAMDSAYRGVV